MKFLFFFGRQQFFGYFLPFVGWKKNSSSVAKCLYKHMCRHFCVEKRLLLEGGRGVSITRRVEFFPQEEEKDGGYYIRGLIVSCCKKIVFVNASLMHFFALLSKISDLKMWTGDRQARWSFWEEESKFLGRLPWRLTQQDNSTTDKLILSTSIH